MERAKSGTRRGNGEGSIFKRKDGRWQAIVSMPDGRRKYVYGHTREEVSGIMRKLIRLAEQNIALVDEHQRIDVFMVKWLEAAKPTLRIRTYERYEQFVRKHIVPTIGHIPLVSLLPEHLQRLYAIKLEEGLSPTTVHHLHMVLHKSLEHAVRWNLVIRNVADLVTPPRMKRFEITPMTAAQVNQLLESVKGNRWEACLTLAITTGMREGELLALRWKDLDLLRGTIQVRGTLTRSKEGLHIEEPKTKKSNRTIVLSKKALVALQRHFVFQTNEFFPHEGSPRIDDLMFPNTVGQPQESNDFLQKIFYPILESAGLPKIRFHDVRHTAATLLLEKGVHPKIVSEILGHSTIGITLDTYSHVSIQMQEVASNAMDEILGDNHN